MLQAGKLVTQINDPLTKVQPDYLYHAVRNPKAAIASQIRQLRIVRDIDANAYRNLKKQLPYVTCGIFNPPVRRTENFAWIDHFIVDIDHLTQKQISVEGLREKLKQDQRVKLLFLSPGEDGLKVLFCLSEKCYDAGQYSLFYKVFIRNFSQQYGLEQVVDERTSDVARACFVSVDPDAYFNAEADPVSMESFVDFSNVFETRQLMVELKLETKQAAAKEKEHASAIETSTGPDAEILREIRNRLNPNQRTKRDKSIYVPDEINEIMEQVRDRMTDLGIQLYDLQNIHYGKKLRFKHGTMDAEINLFYGKRGFSVVLSPRHGTNSELNELCAQALAQIVGL